MQKYLKLNIIIEIIALTIAAYLTYHHFTVITGTGSFDSFCTLSSKVDCDIVNTSSYSEFLNIPISIWGATYYLLSIFLSIFILFSEKEQKDTLVLLSTLKFTAFLYSIFLFIVSLTQIKAICILCMSLYLLNIISLILVIKSWKLSSFSNNSYFSFLLNLKDLFTQTKTYYWLITGVVLLFLIYLPTKSSFAPPIETSSDSEQSFFVSSFRTRDSKNIDLTYGTKLGNTTGTAKLQIVEFADFQCPHCAIAAKQMHRILKIYKDKIFFVFRNFPLDPKCNPKVKVSLHNYACLAAQAAICSRKFNKFEEFFKTLFENQQDINESNIEKWAQNLQIDLPSFKSCLSAKDTIDELKADIEQAILLQIEGTPSFFVNGKKIDGILDENKIKWLLKEVK